MKRYHWATLGDVNAFFGLMLDNTANLVLAVSLLSAAPDFPVSFALRYMIPGTAAGVLLGDLIFTCMAFRLAWRTGKNDVTAMPLGLDTPSTIGNVIFVLIPAYMAAKGGGASPEDAAAHCWRVGVCVILLSGVFKLACAPLAGAVRRAVPRAGLLGSLAAIALVLISFLPLLDIFHAPLPGLVALAIILTTMVARIEAPFKIPGSVLALAVGGGIYYLMLSVGLLHSETPRFAPQDALLPTEWLAAFRFEWVHALEGSLRYLPVALPFALATVVGGIDCAESAAAVGDDYSTGWVVGAEGIATLAAGLCGGVIQTTPYIGHPAYKAMGGRAAYTLATALFVGGAGLLGYFGYLYLWIPKPVIFPILVFIGLEIVSQSYHATPARHYAAVAVACVPALAYLVTIYADQLLSALGGTPDGGMVKLEASIGGSLLAKNLQTMRMLSGGFLITGLLWASALAALIDRRLRLAALFFSIAAACSLFGIVHSPASGSPMALPWSLPDLPKSAQGQLPMQLAMAYLAMAGLLFAWGPLVEPANHAAVDSLQDR